MKKRKIMKASWTEKRLQPRNRADDKHFDVLYALKRRYDAHEITFGEMLRKIDSLERSVEAMSKAHNITWGALMKRTESMDSRLESIELQTRRTVSHLTSEAKVRASVNLKIMDKLDKLAK